MTTTAPCGDVSWWERDARGAAIWAADHQRGRSGPLGAVQAGCATTHIHSIGSMTLNNYAAQLLAEAYPAGCITVAAESYGENTTSFGAGGLWKPFSLGEV